MGNKNKVIDPLPDIFASEEEAGEFWDTHSTEDYSEYFVDVDEKIDIAHRIFEVCVSEDVFRKLQHESESLHQSVSETADQILRKELTTA
jgi:hypothetical protein